MRPLAVAGNVNVDLIMGPVAPWPRAGTEIFVDHEELRAGGEAGNVALAWRALGADFQIAGNLGNDEFGRYLRGEFGDLARRWPVAPAPTTLSVGLTHPDGERTFLTTRGHLPVFSLADVLECLDGSRLSGGLLLVCGIFLLPELARQSADLFAWAREHDIDVALDTGWPPGGWTDGTAAEARVWLSGCRHLLFNEVEACAITGATDVETAARALLDLMAHPEAEVVVKRGAEGALGLGRGGEAVRLPATPVQVVDTIGAGDAFDAGYLFAVASGAGLEDAIRQGIDTASAAISTVPRRYEGAAQPAKSLSQ